MARTIGYKLTYRQAMASYYGVFSERAWLIMIVRSPTSGQRALSSFFENKKCNERDWKRAKGGMLINGRS